MPAMDRRPCAILFALLAFSYVYFFGLRGANPNARYDQTVSIVAHRTIHIDRYVANTPDWALYGGHYYPNKPPGLALLAVPVYAACYPRFLHGALDHENVGSRLGLRGHASLVPWVLISGVFAVSYVFFALGTTGAKEWFGLKCPGCGRLTSRAADFLFRRARCVACNTTW